MKFTANNYNRYKDTKVSLYPKKTFGDKLNQYRWEVIIPFIFIIFVLIIIIMMQMPKSI